MIFPGFLEQDHGVHLAQSAAAAWPWWTTIVAATAGFIAGVAARSHRIWRTLRWTLAIAIAAGWGAVNAYWLLTGHLPVCQVTTTRPGTTVTQTCTGPNAWDALYVLAIVLALVVWDIPHTTRQSIGKWLNRVRRVKTPLGEAEIGPALEPAANLNAQVHSGDDATDAAPIPN